ncbi:MAG: DUF3857 domain-containing protein [Tannerellaceae bacterium]|jgi:hypothetical protein|nr:DUF3857 domain-containing protein [Tannerellaceae bacterium]
MKRIYTIILLNFIASLSLFAVSEAEYGALSKTYRLNADGSFEYRYNMNLTLFTHTAMNRTYGESFIVYNPAFQELKIHTSYTRQKDGTIIKTPENAFVEVLPRQAANAPAYNRLREMVVVHTGLELGATIYLDYSIISKPGYLPELDICDAIEQTSPVKEYTITLSVPENKPLHYALINSAVKPSVRSSNGVTEVNWRIRNLPAASVAPLVSAAGGGKQLLVASTYASNEEAIKTLSKQFTPADDMPLLSLSETLTERSTTDTEKLQAILAHVVDHVGLSRLSLQETGFRIRSSTDDVNPSAYGTEAEKLNLLTGLLNAAGIKAEAAAAYYTRADLNGYGLSGIDELFVLANADGKQYLLTPKTKLASPVDSYTNYAQYVSITNSGKQITLKAPDKKLEYAYSITLSPEKAEIQTNGTDKRDQTLVNNNGYILLSLPESAEGISNAAYKTYNSKREVNLLLPGKANENYTYTIQLPPGMELSTPETTQTTDNVAGKATYAVRQDGNRVEVKRTLNINKQLITPADYASFRNLMIEWADINKRRLLFKVTKAPAPGPFVADARPTALLDSILQFGLDREALFTILGNVKPMSSVISFTYPIANADSARRTSANILNRTEHGRFLDELHTIQELMNRIDFPDLRFIVVPYQDAQDNKRIIQVSSVRISALDSLLRKQESFFGQFGLVPGADPNVVASVIENAGIYERYRGYGYLFGYPDHAVDFFVDASLALDTSGTFVSRAFFNIPVHAGKEGYFVYANPADYAPAAVDSAIYYRAQDVLSRYEAIRSNYLNADSTLQAFRLLQEFFYKP